MTKELESVVDPFCGSGTTLIACEKTNRKCYGMELDEKYVSVIISRYCNYTDNYDIRINGEDVNWNEYSSKQD
jgi:DNA modification methylase